MNWTNIITEHWVEALMAATIGMTGVVLSHLMLGKSLRRLKASQYFFGFVMMGYLFLLGVATGVLVVHDISMEVFRIRPFNLIPFARFVMEQGLLNVLLFLPLGLLLPLVFLPLKKKAWGKILLASFGVSLMVELLQLFHVWRSFDINDLIFNTIGGLLGYGLYLVVARLFRR
jgi:glycopeptide antibiotics resistance protein